MTNKQIIQISNKYQSKLDALGHLDIYKDTENPGSFPHISWMLYEIINLVNGNKLEKANRWLGFIQGALWSLNVFTIEEMREDNMEKNSLIDFKVSSEDVKKTIEKFPSYNDIRENYKQTYKPIEETKLKKVVELASKLSTEDMLTLIKH